MGEGPSERQLPFSSKTQPSWERMSILAWMTATGFEWPTLVPTPLLVLLLFLPPRDSCDICQKQSPMSSLEGPKCVAGFLGLHGPEIMMCGDLLLIMNA